MTVVVVAVVVVGGGRRCGESRGAGGKQQGGWDTELVSQAVETKVQCVQMGLVPSCCFEDGSRADVAQVVQTEKQDGETEHAGQRQRLRERDTGGGSETVAR